MRARDKRREASLSAQSEYVGGDGIYESLGKESMLMDRFYVKYADAGDLLRSQTPLKPTKLFDDLAIIGGLGTAMFVLETKEGLVLFDAILPEEAFKEIYENGMKELGYDPHDVCALYVSHGHFDHYGQVNHIVETYHVPFYMSGIDYEFGLADADRRERPDYRMRAVPTFVDTDEIHTYGDTKIQIVQTPGHTPGGISFIIPVHDDTRLLHAALWGGTSLPDEPHMKRVYLDSLQHFKTFTDKWECDAELCAHTFMDNTLERLEYQRSRLYGMPNPFAIGREAYLRYADMLMEMAVDAVKAADA